MPSWLFALVALVPLVIGENSVPILAWSSQEMWVVSLLKLSLQLCPFRVLEVWALHKSRKF